MRLALALLLVLGAAAAAVVAARPAARAQEAPWTLYVSGLRIGGKSRAVVRVRNTSGRSLDFYALHYTVRDVDGVALSRVGAGPSGAALRAGHTLDLDLGEIVDRYRAEFGVGPFSGPVQFVAYSEDGPAATRPFGPDVVQVEAVQTEGRATYTAVVEWRR